MLKQQTLTKTMNNCCGSLGTLNNTIFFQKNRLSLIAIPDVQESSPHTKMIVSWHYMFRQYNPPLQPTNSHNILDRVARLEQNSHTRAKTRRQT